MSHSAARHLEPPWQSTIEETWKGNEGQGRKHDLLVTISPWSHYLAPSNTVLSRAGPLPRKFIQTAEPALFRLLHLLSSIVEKLFLCLSSILCVYVSDCSLSVISVRQSSRQPLAFERQELFVPLLYLQKEMYEHQTLEAEAVFVLLCSSVKVDLYICVLGSDGVATEPMWRCSEMRKLQQLWLL